MKKIKNEEEMQVMELSEEELQNTYGGYWWETKLINGEIWLIFHPYDD